MKFNVTYRNSHGQFVKHSMVNGAAIMIGKVFVAVILERIVSSVLDTAQAYIAKKQAEKSVPQDEKIAA